MREKFFEPRNANDQEQTFIRIIEKYGDKGIKLDSLCILVFNDRENSSNARTLRKYKERYNNYKYISNTPQGEIHVIKGYYYLIKPNSPLARYYRLKAQYDLICAAIAKVNSKRTLGELQALGQISLDTSNYEELQEYRELIELELERVE